MSAAAADGREGRRAAMNPQDLERLATLAMPYGRYKGTLLADLPGNYLAWFAREGFPRGEIGRLLALMLEIDHNGLRHLLQPLRAGAGQGRSGR
jgi:uncharacterized protein (DUF3820 family)